MFDSVTRLEVIDHRVPMDDPLNIAGRVFGAHNCQITLSLQDNGRTLKVFVDDRKPIKKV